MLANDAPHKPGELAGPAEAILILPGIGLGICDKFRNGVHREVRQDFHDATDARYARDRCDVAKKIEAQVVVKDRIEGIGRGAFQKCISVGARANDFLGRKIAAPARPVFDEEGLTEPSREPSAGQARANVESAAGGKAND